MVRRDEALRGLQRELTGRQFYSSTVLDVSDGGSAGFLVRVRSGKRLQPHVLAISADERSLAFDHGLDQPLSPDDVQEWTRGVVTWLMVELDTGVLRTGQRVTLEDGTVAVDPARDRVPTGPWYVTYVPLERPSRAGQRRIRRRLLWRLAPGGHRRVVTLGDDMEMEPDPAPGSYLSEVGFDVAPGRAICAAGRLVRWLQLFRDSSGGAAPIGQLVVAWRDQPQAVAALEQLELKPSATRGAIEELVLTGVHDAADAGARWIEYRCDDRSGLGPDLPWESVDDVPRLNVADVP